MYKLVHTHQHIAWLFVHVFPRFVLPSSSFLANLNMFEGFGWKSSWKKKKEVCSVLLFMYYILWLGLVFENGITLSLYSFLLGWMFSSPRRRLFYGLFFFLSQFWDSASSSYSYSFGYCRFTLWISEGGRKKKRERKKSIKGFSIFSIIIVCVAQAGASSIPHAPPENGRQNSREIFSTVFSFLLLPRMFRFFSLGRLGIVDRIFTSWPCARVLICLIFMGGIIRRYLQCATRFRRSHNSQVCGLHRSES